MQDIQEIVITQFLKKCKAVYNAIKTVINHSM